MFYLIYPRDLKNLLKLKLPLINILSILFLAFHKVITTSFSGSLVRRLLIFHLVYTMKANRWQVLLNLTLKTLETQSSLFHRVVDTDEKHIMKKWAIAWGDVTIRNIYTQHLGAWIHKANHNKTEGRNCETTLAGDCNAPLSAKAEQPDTEHSI